MGWAGKYSASVGDRIFRALRSLLPQNTIKIMEAAISGTFFTVLDPILNTRSLVGKKPFFFQSMFFFQNGNGPKKYENLIQSLEHSALGLTSL